MSRLAGHALQVDEAVYEAELRDANRNMGLGYMLKAAGIIEGDPVEIVSGYIRQCAVAANVRDLALMAATLANGGNHPLSGEQVIRRDAVRQVLSVMTTCGMYDTAGDWVSTVGIPAKSGVSGGIIGALPGQLGLAVFSPRVDAHGTSVRGVAACERLSRDMGLHMMEVEQIGRSTVRRVELDAGAPGVPVYELRGAVRFGGAELLSRTLEQDLGGGGAYADAGVVVLSLRHTHSLNGVAQRLLQETIRRLRGAGVAVVLVDPAGLLDLTPLDAGMQPLTVDDDAAAVQAALSLRIG